MNRTLLMIATLLGVALGAAAALPPGGILLDSYAAIVHGKVITVGDVLSAMQPIQERLAAQYHGRELEQRLQEEFDAVRDALIEAELILLDFETQGGNIPDRAIEDHVNSVIFERFGNDRAAFLRALAAERLTFSEWRRKMKDQLIVQVMSQREVQSRILVTPLDIKQAYEQNRQAYSLPERFQLRTLVLPGGEDPNGVAQAADLRQRILSGKLAIEDAGGTLGAPEWFEAASLNSRIRQALDGVTPGGLTAPVELAGQLYLVQLLEHQEARVRSLDEVTPELESELRRAEFERLRRIWIDTLRSKYFVQLFAHPLFD